MKKKFAPTWHSHEPFDKAGAYAIQGLASKFVTHISGCYFNVVGLPVPLLYEISKRSRKESRSQESEVSRQGPRHLHSIWLHPLPSENYSLVAFAAGHALTIEVFEQRDGVLAGESGELLEFGHPQAIVLCFTARQDFAKVA